MRVTIASYDGEPPIGGQGVYVRGLRGALSARGIEVTLLSGHGEGAVRFPRITGRAPLDFSVALARDPSALVRTSPQVVHAQGGPGGVLLLRRLPVPLVYTAHHTYRQAHGLGSVARVLSGAERLAYRRAARVLAVSASTAGALRALGVPSGRVEVVPPGIDVERLAGAGDGATREPDRVLFVGRLEPEKGVLDAVAVMTAVAARRRVRGVVVGTGRLDAEVRRLAAASGGDVCLMGAVSDAELREEYARASVLLMPSRYEGLGLAALEAMASGCVVVGYDVDGLRDAVGDAGVLVERGHRDDLLAACMRLLEDAAWRSELSRRGQAQVRRAHSWEAVARRVHEVYSDVLG